jgi:hypothetical protein
MKAFLVAQTRSVNNQKVDFQSNLNFKIIPSNEIKCLKLASFNFIYSNLIIILKIE